MIYLNNAATSFPKAPGVAEALFAQVSSMGGNPGRAGLGSALGSSLDADRLLLAAREALCRLIGVPDAYSERMIFTKNATEAINIVLLGIVQPGDTVVTSSLEHNAVMRPLRWLEKTRGTKILVIRCDEGGTPDRADLAAALARSPNLAVFTMASNVSGALLPWEELARLFRKAGSLVCLDASQAIGHMEISAASDIDYLCFPGHKGLLGPTGTGCLYIAGDTIPEALIRGGTGSRSDLEIQPGELPDRFEAGTQNLPGAAGLLAATAFLASKGVKTIGARESALTERLIGGLGAISGIRVHGPLPGFPRAPVVSISSERPPLDELARGLDLRGIAVRMGLHCAPAAHRSIGTFSTGGTIRFSPGFFTTEAEIDETIRAMEDIVARGGSDD